MRQIKQSLRFWRALLIASAFVLGALLPMLAAPAKTQAAPTLPAYRYTKQFDTTASGAFAEASAVATDNKGGVYIAGVWQGTVVFDGPGGSDSRTSANTDGFLTKYNTDGSYAYTKTFDADASGASADPRSLAVDSNGNIYVVGDWQGTVVFDGPGGSDSQTTNNNNAFVTKYSSTGNYLSTKVFDVDTGSGSIDITGITTDGAGNVYTTGTFGGTVVLDGPGGSDSQTSNNGSSFITKYTVSGTYVYTKITDTSSGSSEGMGIATDNNGNVYVGGQFRNTVTFDGPGGSDTFTNSRPDSFVTKYQSNGNYVYTKIFDSSASNARADLFAITTDASGDVYLAGRFRNTVVFDGQGGSDSQTSITADGFLTKFAADGTYLYTRTQDVGASGAIANNEGVVVGSDNNVYVVGLFNGTVVFDGQGGSDSQTSNNGSYFVTQYDMSGNYHYTKITYTDGDPNAFSEAVGIAADTKGNIFIAGDFSGQVIFDGQGGSDSQNGGAGITSLLSSWQTFAPPVSPGSGSLPAAIIAPQAPNTGFGAPPSVSPAAVLGISVLLSAALLLAAAKLDRKPFR